MAALVLTASLSACGGSNVGTAAGWHYQGRDCLSCHNVDLEANKQLTVGGTVFLSPTVTTGIDNLSNVCTGTLRIQFLDSNSNVVLDSVNYEDSGSRGYKGMGNIFILKRTLASLQGDYYLNLTASDGTILAQSGLHKFTASFDKNNPSDLNNRYSCNACHSSNPVNNAPGLIYATTNTDKCK